MTDSHEEFVFSNCMCTFLLFCFFTTSLRNARRGSEESEVSEAALLRQQVPWRKHGGAAACQKTGDVLTGSTRSQQCDLTSTAFKCPLISHKHFSQVKLKQPMLF